MLTTKGEKKGKLSKILGVRKDGKSIKDVKEKLLNA